MIAIAGAKGGCGKTTTTVGLARAFARAETSVLAIDADRQLPNLHVVADVDRRPTYAAVSSGADVTSIAQPHPEARNVGILPAAKPAEQVTVESVVAGLEDGPFEVLIDCPSGVGPDVIEPLSVAEGVVVVTTGTDRSVEAARTTVDVARRLDVPVVGLVGTRCDGPPEDLEARIGVPVLGLVPERDSPLGDEDVSTAYDDAAAKLSSWRRARNASVNHDGPTLPTGIDSLDDAVGGGLPEGSIVALSADPATQAEHLLYAATAPRGTLYLSNVRSAESVRHALQSSPVSTGQPTVRTLSDDPVEEGRSLVSRLPDGATLLVDSVDALERADRDRYVAFLADLERSVRETGSLAILHCHDGPGTPANRSLTAQVADAVFEFEPPAASGDRRPGERGSLAVSKFRFDSGYAGRIPVDDLLDAGRPDPDFGSQ